MKLRHALLAAVICQLAPLAAHAQDKGYWRSASTNANAITGDIQIYDGYLDLYFHRVPLSRIRNLKPEESMALFDVDSSTPGTGFLYRIKLPAGTRLMRDNSLCGNNDAQWMASYISGRTLRMAFFSGDEMPVLSFEALTKSMDDCGHFTYAR